MHPAARKTNMTGYGPPIAAPGPGSLDIDIGFLPARRALPAGVGDGLKEASDQMKQLMSKPVLAPADAMPVLAQVQVGATQASAKENPAAIEAVAGGFATLQATGISLTVAWTGATVVPAAGRAKDRRIVREGRSPSPAM